MTHTASYPNLEESLAEISTLIEKMERGELSLEASLEHFERGMQLVKHCQKTLTEAEQKVQMLLQKNQQEHLIHFNNDEGKKQVVHEPSE